jgi:hypothetical protein
MELTPASNRPWVSGTSDNSVLSLILDYNGLNRVGGQAGVPTGAGGNMSGGTPGPLRLLSSALGGQVGWLLGFVLVTSLGMVVASRLRRSDARSGWLLAVGGGFLVTAVLFSSASGIFHPYYVALLAPFIAALAGAGFAELTAGRLNVRVLGPLAVAAAVAVELVIRGRYPGNLSWLTPLLIIVGALAASALLAFAGRRVRLLAVSSALLALLIAPTVWAVDTLGYAASGTFPSGGPASVATGPGAGPPGRFGRPFARLGAPRGFAVIGGGPGQPTPFGAAPGGPPPGAAGQPPPGAGAFPPRGGPLASGGSPGALGGRFGDGRSIASVLTYVRRHGGGTIAVSSQSSAAAAIIEKNANVAGIGGFSGRESDVSTSWLAQEVRSGRIRWVLVEATAGRPGLAGDTRVGAKPAMRAVASACQPASRATASGSSTGLASASSKLYDCQGRAVKLAGAGRSSS